MIKSIYCSCTGPKCVPNAHRKLDGSQPPINPAPGDPKSSSDLLRGVGTHTETDRQTNSEDNYFKIKKN